MSKVIRARRSARPTLAVAAASTGMGDNDGRGGFMARASGIRPDRGVRRRQAALSAGAGGGAPSASPGGGAALR
jgi:hypothetical protein